jgi:two-component system OmpR family sensor kinase
MTSIRRWLLRSLIFRLAATSLATVYGIFHTARREASELFDYELRTVALSLLANIAIADAAERRTHDTNGIADARIAIDIRDKQVAQSFSVREDLALRLAWRTLWPLAMVVPVTVALVLFFVARGLGPIGGLSRALSPLSLDSLEPLQAGARVPVEVRPLVNFRAFVRDAAARTVQAIRRFGPGTRCSAPRYQSSTGCRLGQTARN